MRSGYLYHIGSGNTSYLIDFHESGNLTYVVHPYHPWHLDYGMLELMKRETRTWKIGVSTWSFKQNSKQYTKIDESERESSGIGTTNQYKYTHQSESLSNGDVYFCVCPGEKGLKLAFESWFAN